MMNKLSPIVEEHLPIKYILRVQHLSSYFPQPADVLFDIVMSDLVNCEEFGIDEVSGVLSFKLNRTELRSLLASLATEGHLMDRTVDGRTPRYTCLSHPWGGNS